MDAIFAGALDRDGVALQRYLDEECAGDKTLRAEVESMLRFSRAAENFLETPVMLDATAIWPDQAPSLTTQPRHAIDNARFIPGDVVAGRYRIVGLLGRGGMGEVYRADDLKLAQPVALKFLAESLSRNGAALARFHREVSVARQISHRHVCRVYDIGEHAGMHFLSMEYVRGEELSSLLKRIGRLPLDKALETARQLCAGLAAIHTAGVLHRDLKPANVMIDEHGDVRITDFGVAALAEGVSGREAMIGTPVYMSPEQLSGGTLTTRSDLYALGLVLYEAFTGNRPFTATALADIVRDRLGDTAPATPSSWITGLDPLVERVILRCLEKDPDRRPASALQVAAALGGDPLAAALAAGETPSPQMVAASAKLGTLRPLHAVLLLAWIVVALTAVVLLSDRSLHRHMRMPLSFELLRARASDIAAEAGYEAQPVDGVAEVGYDLDTVRYVDSLPQPDRWERFRRAPLPAVYFWDRGSPVPLVRDGDWRVSPRNPPNTVAGMTLMALDMEGRLLLFEGVPPQVDRAVPPLRAAEWSRFFDRAGLRMSMFRPIAPRWTPPHHSDERRAWMGVHPLRPDLPLRVEAAAYRGKPVWFEVIFPWQMPDREPSRSGAGTDPFSLSLLVLYFGAMALAALLAWKNVRLGRGDRSGTFRLTSFIFATRILYWVVTAHHVAIADEVITLFVNALASGLYWAALLGLMYLALEPFVRRRWPEGLISWSRLLAGDLRDPLVGRDILIGGAAGLAAILANHLHPFRSPAVGSNLLYELGLRGAKGYLPLLLNQTAGSILFTLIVFSVVLFFAMITRRNAIAWGLTWLLLYFVLNLNFGDGTPLGYAISLLFPTLLIGVLWRYGMLAMIAQFFYLHFWPFYPHTTDLSAWYAPTFLLQFALLTLIALFAFRTSLAGQKLTRAFDE
ncbi:MAG: eukaryotic-like serine/threonine-protein kinase [Acidobacteriota bacterium]|nr:eukaryotic-like serine/threonine-protein kinase [Acidobacteriota bacterium]